MKTALNETDIWHHVSARRDDLVNAPGFTVIERARYFEGVLRCFFPLETFEARCAVVGSRIMPIPRPKQ